MNSCMRDISKFKYFVIYLRDTYMYIIPCTAVKHSETKIVWLGPKILTGRAGSFKEI